MVLDGELPEELVHPTKLGFWDLEKEISQGIFIQPKVYYEKPLLDGTEETKKFKGVRKETKNNFTKEFYEKLYNVLSEKELKTYKVEENRMLMRGVKYQQKTAVNGVVDYK